MKITVHIGSTKTGSSALQMHLSQAREHLKDVGVLYSEIGTKSNAHHVLFAAAHPGAWGMHRDELSRNEDERFGYFIDTLAQIVKEAESLEMNHIVLSSEYWWGVLPDRFQRFIAEQFQEHEVRLVACLRRQDRWLEASYLQAVKSGEDKLFELWLDEKLKTPTLGGAHYLKILNHWNETLLPAETLVIPYDFTDRTEYIKRISEKVCDDKVGDIVVPNEAKVVNRSPNAEGVKAILKLNSDSNHEVARAERMAEIMGKHSRPENTEKGALLTEMDESRFIQQFEQSNALVHRLYCRDGSNCLFGETGNLLDEAV